MEELNNDYPNFKLVPIKLGLRTDFFYSFFSKENKCQVISLPDSSYGQWLIFNKDQKPRYYFNAINEDGTLNGIAKFVEEKGIVDIESFLISMLNKKGYKELSSIERSPLVSIKKSTGIVEYDLFQLVD